MLYLALILISSALITLINTAVAGFGTAVFLEILLTVTAAIIAVFIIDALAALFARRLPERWFLPEARLFGVGKREIAFLRKTKINLWKRVVPEWGCFTGFHKDKLRSSSDSEYLGRFLIESNYGVLGHILGALRGFLILLIPQLQPLSVALPVALINALLSLLPTAVLRFNTPALRRLYRRSLKLSEKRNESREE